MGGCGRETEGVDAGGEGPEGEFAGREGGGKKGARATGGGKGRDEEVKLTSQLF